MNFSKAFKEFYLNNVTQANECKKKKEYFFLIYYRRQTATLCVEIRNGQQI